jgi:hypothetical protein
LSKFLPQSGRQIAPPGRAHGSFFIMVDAATRLLPAAAKFARQIVPPVIATLIAAGLISAYNRAFSGHLQQPRMSALHKEVDEAPVVTLATVSKPEAVAIYDNIAPPPRLWDKERRQDAGKDQTSKTAEAASAPVRTAAPRPEPKSEPRRVASAELPPAAVRAPAPVLVPAPVIVATPPAVVAPPASAPVVAALPTVQELRQPVLPPPPVVAAQPHYQQPQYAQPPYQHPPYQSPTVITAQPVVTVPDKSRATEQAQAEPPARGTFGRIVDTLKPSNLFARAREFGEKIEAAGNDILPSIRQ